MTSTMFQIIERPERDKKSKWQSGHSQSAQLTKRPRLHCSGGSVCRLQVAHTAQTTAVQRKRSGDCSFNRSSPPEKRPRLQGVSYAFLRKIQETSKEQTFGKVGPCSRSTAGNIHSGIILGTFCLDAFAFQRGRAVFLHCHWRSARLHLLVFSRFMLFLLG